MKQSKQLEKTSKAKSGFLERLVELVNSWCYWIRNPPSNSSVRNGKQDITTGAPNINRK